MSRNILLAKQIVTGQREADQPLSATPDNYASQIVKLIPVEIVGIYLGISNLIEGQKISDPAAIENTQWVVFLTILIITPFYLYRAAGVTDKLQISLATFSFTIWALSLGGPFALYFDHRLAGGVTIKFLGGIILMIYSLIVPVLYKIPNKS